jgi:hypothetical protein
MALLASCGPGYAYGPPAMMHLLPRCMGRFWNRPINAGERRFRPFRRLADEAVPPVLRSEDSDH